MILPTGNIQGAPESRPTERRLLIQVWLLRLLIPLAILSWVAVGAVFYWLAGHFITPILLFVFASLFAFAIAPVVRVFQRVMPRFLAIILVYVIGLSLFALLIYFVLTTSMNQIVSLANSAGDLFKPGRKGALPPIIEILRRFGLSQEQVDSFGKQLTSQLEGIATTVASGVVPLVSGIAGAAINIILGVVLSIYLLVDGSRATRWLRTRTPRIGRGLIRFLIDVVEQVIGGYIRGQFLLSFVVGIMVGGGMAALGVPYAVLLGVLSFVTEFIPVLGTLITGVICVLLALTQGWLTTVLVIAYFVIVHIIEGYVLAPRLVGKAVGLHPIVSLLALTAGAELFGPWGAILASPVVGLLQVIVTTTWRQWRRDHPEQFPGESVGITGERVTSHLPPLDPHTPIGPADGQPNYPLGSHEQPNIPAI